MAKINDKGTSDRDDDHLAGGAVFVIRVDDGDGTYEPGGDDGSPIAELEAEHGYGVFVPPGPGDYWVKEKTPPKGLTTAPAMLVEYAAPSSPENCLVLDGKKQCVADDDNNGGFTMAVIQDSPKDIPPPATDTVTEDGPANNTPWFVIAALIGTIAAATLITGPSRRRR